MWPKKGLFAFSRAALKREKNFRYTFVLLTLQNQPLFCQIGNENWMKKRKREWIHSVTWSTKTTKWNCRKDSRGGPVCSWTCPLIEQSLKLFLPWIWTRSHLDDCRAVQQHLYLLVSDVWWMKRTICRSRHRSLQAVTAVAPVVLLVCLTSTNENSHCGKPSASESSSEAERESPQPRMWVCS